MYLTSCAPSKISLTEKDKSNSPNIEIGSLAEKSKREEPARKKTATQVASSVNDKALADLAKKLQVSRLDVLSNSTVICTVNGDPITVGDYRHQFKTEQEQVQASLSANPQVSNKLIQMAQEQGVTLSLEEKKASVRLCK